MQEPVILIPNRQDVKNLSAGDKALDSFGKYRRVTEIYGRGEDPNGKAWVCFYTEFGPSSTCSHSYKEGKLVRHAGLSAHYTSTELDEIEQSYQ